MQEKHLKNRYYRLFFALDKIWANWNDFKPLTLAKWHLTQRNTHTHSQFTAKLYFPILTWFIFFSALELFRFSFLCSHYDAFELVTSIHCWSFTSNVLCWWIFIRNIFIALSWCHFCGQAFQVIFPFDRCCCCCFHDLHKYPFSPYICATIAFGTCFIVNTILIQNFSLSALPLSL